MVRSGTSVPAAMMLPEPTCGAVQDDAAHADQAARFDGAAVQDDGVAYGDVVAEDQGVRVAHHVDTDGTVLSIRARADAHRSLTSPRSTAHGHTLECSPMTTSPITTAWGSM